MAEHCTFCDYYQQQHNSQCCCVGCWRARQQQQQPQLAHTQEAARGQANGSVEEECCPHASDRHHCRACVLPPYRYKTCRGGSNDDLPLPAGSQGKARTYQCVGCHHKTQDNAYPIVPLVGCGCRRSCSCRRATCQASRRAQEVARAAAEAPRFAAHKVPKMGLAAAAYMLDAPGDRERVRFQY